MGTPNPNYYAAFHVGDSPAVPTGHRLVHHHGSAFDDSPDIGESDWNTIKAAAAQSYPAFDSAVAAVVPNWWGQWSTADKTAWRQAVQNL